MSNSPQSSNAQGWGSGEVTESEGSATIRAAVHGWLMTEWTKGGREAAGGEAHQRKQVCPQEWLVVPSLFPFLFHSLPLPLGYYEVGSLAVPVSSPQAHSNGTK